METPEQKAFAAEVDRLTKLLATLRERGQTTVDTISGLKVRLQESVSLRESLAGIEAGFKSSVAGLKDRLSALGLQADALMRLSVTYQPLDEKTAEFKKAIADLEHESQAAFSGKTDFAAVTTLPDLRAAYVNVQDQIQRLTEQLSTPQRRYQSYLERIAEWSVKRLTIVGSDEDPKPETLNWLENNRRFLDKQVAEILAQKIAARAEIVGKIFESKSNVLKFYCDLKESVEGRLKAVRSEGFQIEIDASFIVDRDFRRQFLHHINQRKRGPFRNDQDAQQELARAIQDTDWSNAESVIAFGEGLIARMRTHNGEALSVADQTNSVKELYDFLFSLDYLSPKYELRLGDKNLNELSPGEKGLLLLIFYLQLDRNNTPLVIDQPEDNLDNDSIFKVLARCIRDAKKHRQVILVTHNPNLAVGADAEEIVYVKLDKTQRYKFSYESGSIENPALNRRIVDVLEGSQPAFVKRRLKYGIK